MVLQAQRRRKVSNYLLRWFQGNIYLCRTKCMTILSHCGPSQSIYTETTWPYVLLLVWKLQQHSQELEKKTMITQTCHNHLKDMSLKAVFPEWHRQAGAVGSKASALLCEHKWSPSLWEVLGPLCHPFCLSQATIFSCGKFSKSFLCW